MKKTIDCKILKALYLCGFLVGCLVVGCHHFGNSSDVTLIFEGAQLIQPYSTILMIQMIQNIQMIKMIYMIQMI